MSALTASCTLPATSCDAKTEPQPPRRRPASRMPGSRAENRSAPPPRSTGSQAAIATEQSPAAAAVWLAPHTARAQKKRAPGQLLPLQRPQARKHEPEAGHKRAESHELAPASARLQQPLWRLLPRARPVCGRLCSSRGMHGSAVQLAESACSHGSSSSCSATKHPHQQLTPPAHIRARARIACRVLVVESGRYQLVHCHGSAYELRDPLAGNGTQGAGLCEETCDQARLFCPRFAVAASSQVVYFTDANCVRRFMPATREIRTLAGVPARIPPAEPRSSSGEPPESRFNAPWGLALDEEAGVLYVADSVNHAIKRVAIASGEVTTLVAGGCGLRYPIGLVSSGGGGAQGCAKRSMQALGAAVWANAVLHLCKRRRCTETVRHSTALTRAASSAWTWRPARSRRLQVRARAGRASSWVSRCIITLDYITFEAGRSP